MRFKELLLLLIILALSAAGFYASSAENPFVLAATTNLPFILLNVFHSFVFRRADEKVLPLVSLVTNLGLLNLYGINPSYFYAQLRNLYFAAALSMLLAYLFSLLKKPFLFRFVYGLCALLLFLIPIFAGKEAYGARLWVSLAGVSFQPSEIARVLFILFLAGYFAEKRSILHKESGLSFKKRFVYLLPAITMTLFSLLILVYVKDLGFSLLILSVFLVALFISTSNFYYVSGSLLLFFAGSFLAYRIFPHVESRINIWLNPWKDPYGESYQILQSLFAYAEGSITGVGLKMGFPSMVPAAHTDMVIPVFAEVTGISGPIIVLSALFLLSLILVAGALKARITSEKIFLATAGFSLFFQTFLVSSGTLNLLPLTGLTVPFFSYGGSSLVASLVLIEISLTLTSRKERWIVR